MEKIDYSSLELPKECDSFVEDNILFLKKWNWNYSEFLEYQAKFQDFVRTHKDAKIYIFTNHPHCFTLGRGNERGESSLVQFDESLRNRLDFPVYDIHRGGGITYHYPGQWIFYPILRVTPKYTLHDHMCWLLKLVRDHINETYDLKSIATEKIMGVWLNKKKIASIGVGLNRFVTEHGLAFNLNEDLKMSEELKKINPCGLDSQVYTFLNQVTEQENISVEKFHSEILDSLKAKIKN